MFWGKILNALIHEIETNPDKVLEILDNIIGLLKSNPKAVEALVPVIVERMKSAAPKV